MEAAPTRMHTAKNPEQKKTTLFAKFVESIESAKSCAQSTWWNTTRASLTTRPYARTRQCLSTTVSRGMALDAKLSTRLGHMNEGDVAQ